METFWRWWVRNLALALLVVALLAGFTGVVDWSLSLTTTMVLAFVAFGADALVSRAKRRRQIRQELADVRQAPREEQQRRAA